MLWNKDGRLATGGFWRCNVKHREAARKRAGTPARLEDQRRYRESPAGALTRQLGEMSRVRIRY